MPGFETQLHFKLEVPAGYPGGSWDGSGPWVPATYVGTIEFCTPGSSLGQTQLLGGISGMNQREMGTFFLVNFFPISLPFK